MAQGCQQRKRGNLATVTRSVPEEQGAMVYWTRCVNCGVMVDEFETEYVGPECETCRSCSTQEEIDAARQDTDG